MVLNAVDHAASHEPRVRHGEEDSVQALLQKVSSEVESRAASEENPPEAIQARSAAERPEKQQRQQLRQRRN